MIDLGADLNLRNENDLSPLMLSCKEGLTEIAEYLIANGAVINETNILADTPLKLAQKNGHEDLALLLINKHGAVINNRPASRKK